MAWAFAARNGVLGGCVRIVAFLLLLAPVAAQAALTVTPITWDIVGLDSNSPSTGPRHFPVGARVCSDIATTNVSVSFTWESANAFIDLRPGTLSTINFASLGAGACADAYFEVEVVQNAAAFDTTRRYRIVATDASGSASTPTPRQLYIEHLVSQSRNAILDIRYGTSPATLASVAAGGSLDLVVGQTYFIELHAATATQGYEQLESFINFTNTVFQILDVDTTYSADTSPIVPNPNDKLYADACGWENDPNSPNYRACLGVGKNGGDIVTLYQIRIIGGGGTSQTLNTLIHDFSGSSFHYNADFGTGARIANIIDPTTARISKAFAPNPATLNGVSVLTFTLTNPNGGALGGYNFVDNLPANLVVANPAGIATSGCGTPTVTASPGSSTITFANGTVAANGTCTVRVNTTASATGSFNNVSNNLFVGTADTGDNATATLVVNNDPPPGTGLCGQSLASWRFPTGFDVNNPLPSTSSVAASAARGAGIVPNTQTNVSPPGPADGTIAWGSNGSITVGAALVTANNEYFEFGVDTTGITSLQVTFDARRTNNGPRGVTLFYGTTNTRPETGTQVATLTPATGLPTTTAVSFTSGPITTGLNPAGTTFFRIYFSNPNNDNPGSDPSLDNVLIAACGAGVKPTIAKSFAPDPVAVNGVSTLTFTLTNTNAAPLTGAAFNDALPAGIQVAATPAASTTCAGVWAPTAGSTNLSFTGGVIPASGSCTVAVNVVATTAGTKTNVSGFLSTVETGTTTTSVATDTLTAIVPPSIDKQFAPSPILPGGTSTLTFTITNPNPDNAVSGVAFTDTFPVAPGAMVVAAVPAASTSGCGAPTFAPVAGAGAVTFSGGTIAPLATCTVRVNVTAPAAGSYVNTSGNVSHVVNAATINGNTASDTLVVNPPNPAIGLLKQVSTSATGPWVSFQAINPPGNVFYRFVVENLGDVPLSGVTVNDPQVNTASCTWPAPLPVAVAANDNHIATCVVGPIAAVVGQNVNTATAQGTFGGTTASDTDSATYATAALTIDKSASPSTYGAAGEVIAYSFLVTNSGFATLAGPVVVNDDRTTNESCPALTTVGDLDGFFDPGESITCSATYTIVAGDVSAGSVVNVASATSGGTTSPSDTATVTVTTPALNTAKAVTGNADGDGSGTVTQGDVLTYTITVTNTGNVPLTNVVVSDNRITATGGTTPCANVPVGGTCTLIGTYTVTAADVVAGSITNTATGDSDQTGPDTDTLITPVGGSPAINTVKALTSNADGDGSGTVTQGDVLTYTVTVTNTGNIGLTNVVVTDNRITATGGSTPCATLAVGASCTLIGTYTVTAADVTTGSITNTGTGDSDQTGPDTDTLVTPVVGSPALNTTKALTSNADGDGSGTVTQGDVLTYTVTVTNTGNVTLTNVVVTDNRITATGGSTPCASLAVGASCTLIGTYTVTAADVTAGSITNTGTGDSDQTGPDTDTLVTPVAGSPALNTAKALTSNADGDGSGTVTQGDVLTYTITVTNTGNIPLTNVVVSDNRITPTGGSTPCASVAVGSTCTLIGTYTVTAADVTAGSITNTGTGDSDQTGPDTDTLITPVAGSPALNTAKALTSNADGDGSGTVTQGDVLTYTVTVTNTGNIALTNVVVTDNRITATGGSTPCASLAVGASCTLIGTYTVTAADVTTGSITNTGTGDSDQTGPDADTVVTPVVGSPALNTAKAVTGNADADGSGTVTQGDVLTYTVTVTNTGNVPLTNVVVTDNRITATGGTTPCASVPVGGTCTLIGTYTVTAADVTAGSITNTATGDSDQTGPDTDTLITPINGSPALDTAKALTGNGDGDGSGTVTQGDVLTYTVTVTNTGNVTLTNVVVTDSRITPTGGSTPCASVAVGSTCTLVGTYTVTAADVTAGSITNTGTGDSNETGPDTATVVTPVVGSPALNTAKAVTGNADGDGSGTVTQGDVLTYTITVTNTGNVPLTNVVVSDNRITATGGSTPCASVPVGGTCTLVGTYTVTAADVTAGSITNTATGDSNETGPDTDTLITPVGGSPALNTAKALTSNADGDGSGTVTQGDVLTYTVTVTNTGNVPLTNVVVSDNRITATGGSTPCASLAVGASCTLVGTYTVTAADVTAGAITNTGTGDSDQTGPDTDTLITPVAGSPALNTAKALTSNADGDGSGTVTQGDVLTYTIAVTNTGNVPLTNVTVVDSRITRTGGSAPCATLAVGASCTLIGTYTVTAADVTAGSITNTATGDSDQTGPDPDTLVTPINGSPAIDTAKALTGNADGDGSGTVTQGDVLTYTITVRNTGNVPVNGVVVTDPLLTRTGGNSPCATLAVGATCTLVGTYTVTGTDVANGNVTNTGTGDAEETPPDTDTEITPVQPSPRLVVAKSVTSNADNDGSGTVTVGDVLTYTITATNTGNVALANIVLTDNRIVRTGGNSPCASLAIGAQCTLVGTYAVTAADGTAGNVTNTATATGTNVCNPTTPGSTCSDTEVTPVGTVPNLAIDKFHAGNFAEGQVGAQFSIVVRNVGTGPTAGTVSVVDTLPAGLTATAIAGTGWSCTLATLTCTRSDALAAGATWPTITLTVNVAASAPPSLVNVSTVSGGGDNTPANNTDSDPVTIDDTAGPSPADLMIDKVAGGSFVRGQPGAFYNLTVRNAGGTATIGTVTVVDAMPAGLVATSISGTGWTCTLSTTTCTRNDPLPVGASYPVIVIAATVDANAPAQLSNVATVSGGGDSNPANNTDGDVQPVGAAPQPALPVPVDATWALALLALAMLVAASRRRVRAHQR